MTWRPGAGLQQLRARADLLARIRRFFADRGVLEVETPLLCSSGITDPAIEPLLVERGASVREPRYLQTSPEYAMKRLLAAGTGPIFQVTRAFRDGEAGARHNPEFTLLEWYRPGFDHHQMMAEVAALVCACLGERHWQKLSYRELFLKSIGIDPLTAGAAELEDCARTGRDLGDMQGDRDVWLALLLTHEVEPWLAGRGMCFVFDYPSSQAALARIEQCDGVSLGQRFELYLDGLELANGYHELTDAGEQRERFLADNAVRRRAGQTERPLDEHLLAALEAGMPACSGVALGVDRLLMLRCGETDIRRVLAFDWQRC
jgi:lysyl-tRNA synthetase class 2